MSGRLLVFLLLEATVSLGGASAAERGAGTAQRAAERPHLQGGAGCRDAPGP